jgi:hypothetical protein
MLDACIHRHLSKLSSLSQDFDYSEGSEYEDQGLALGGISQGSLRAVSSQAREAGRGGDTESCAEIGPEEFGHRDPVDMAAKLSPEARLKLLFTSLRMLHAGY